MLIDLEQINIFNEISLKYKHCERLKVKIHILFYADNLRSFALGHKLNFIQ
jgi:hypothetical protein